MQDQLNTYNQAIGLGKGTIKNFNDLGGITSGILPYLLVIAGLILFVMLVGGGLTMLLGATNKESQDKGKKMVTNAFLGFAILFSAYFLAQALQIIFKIDLVGH